MLCACYAESLALDTAGGGAFTRALYDVASTGLGDASHRQEPRLQLKDLSGPVQKRLTKEGSPLPKLYLGPDLPQFPLVRNVAYQTRTEKLMAYHRDILNLLWDSGKDREVSIKTIDKKLGKSAYGNHSKLSLEPWFLVEDGKNSKYRRLTDRGREFMKGRLTVPNTIEKNAASGQWQPASHSRLISLDEIGLREGRRR